MFLYSLNESSLFISTSRKSSLFDLSILLHEIANNSTKLKGLYLISAVHIEKMNLINKIKYDADYFSKWASLTFNKY